MSIETTRALRWIVGLLSGDGTLTGLVGARIYADIAPQGAALPYVVVSLQAGTDVRGVGPARIMANLLYQVVAWATDGSAASARETLEPIADRIDALLQGGSGTVTGGAIFASVREQPLELVDQDEEEKTTVYRALGGIYRLFAQTT